ncbi:MAG: flavodoxin [Odoribacter sp.]|nr:flavodoxin [Odoribacter sp.]
MNKIFYLWVVLSMATTTFAQSVKTMDKKESNQKILVAYFSATGTTARAARTVANISGGELYTITPEKPYTDADLNWNDKKSRSSVEMNNPKARPALGGKKLDISNYDVIFIGYPIWWNLAPRIINTFIESQEWKGKIIIPFATSGSSSITNSVAQLKQSYPDFDWKEGKLLNRADENIIHTWIQKTTELLKK